MYLDIISLFLLGFMVIMSAGNTRKKIYSLYTITVRGLPGLSESHFPLQGFRPKLRMDVIYIFQWDNPHRTVSGSCLHHPLQNAITKVTDIGIVAPPSNNTQTITQLKPLLHL